LETFLDLEIVSAKKISNFLNLLIIFMRTSKTKKVWAKIKMKVIFSSLNREWISSAKIFHIVSFLIHLIIGTSNKFIRDKKYKVLCAA